MLAKLMDFGTFEWKGDYQRMMANKGKDNFLKTGHNSIYFFIDYKMLFSSLYPFIILWTNNDPCCFPIWVSWVHSKSEWKIKLFKPFFSKAMYMAMDWCPELACIITSSFAICVNSSRTEYPPTVLGRILFPGNFSFKAFF